MSGEDWTYTFCDMRTNIELATLPLTQVKYDRGVKAVGKLDAYLSLADQKVRAMNPWAATRQRRTAVYAEYGDETVWGGVITGRLLSDASDGLSLSCITWEGWLHRQQLLTDLAMSGVSTREAVRRLVERAQVLTDVGLEVDMTGDPGQIRTQTYLAKDVQPILELIADLGTATETPLEYRVDCFRDPATGLFRRIVRLGEPRIGRTYEETGRTFAYPNGGLLHWQLPMDGSGADNVMPWLGSGTGPTQPFGVIMDEDAGIDEIASGFPSWMRPFSSQDTDDVELIQARTKASMRSGLAGETVLTGVQLDPEAYLGKVDPGDDMELEITHRGMREWPASVSYITRLLGESVTVGDGGARDQVSVTVGGAAA